MLHDTHIWGLNAYQVTASNLSYMDRHYLNETEDAWSKIWTCNNFYDSQDYSSYVWLMPKARHFRMDKHTFKIAKYMARRFKMDKHIFVDFVILYM